jgi:hypothetical protein
MFCGPALGGLGRFFGSCPLAALIVAHPQWRTTAIQAFDRSVSLPVAGYNYNSDWTPLLAGLSPAGMAASLAARSWTEELAASISCPQHFQ